LLIYIEWQLCFTVSFHIFPGAQFLFNDGENALTAAQKTQCGPCVSNTRNSTH